MDKSIESWLSEFRALRDEIENRGRVQQALVALNMTALATVLGIAVSSSKLEWWNSAILLVIPFFSSFLSLLHLNHDFTIANIGHYIRDKIRPKLCTLTGDEEMMGWESWTREVPRKIKIPRELTFGLAAPALYIVPSGIILGIVFKDVFSTEGWIQAIWILGLILTLLNLCLWCYRRRYWLGKSPGKHKGRRE